MKTVKKAFSVLLCCTMVFAFFVPVFAQSTSVRYPVIHVPGFDTSTIYTDKDNPDEQIAIPGNEMIVEVIKEELLPALVVYAADQDIDRLADKITSVLNESLKTWFNNPDGTPVGNAGVINYYPTAIGERSNLVFRYDWRGDPLVIASQLNDYINYVTHTSGLDKVAISCHSLGANIVLAYISLYGSDKIYGWVMDTPAIDGVSYVGDLLCGETDITSEGVLTFLKGTLGENAYEDLITSSLDILEMAGMSDLIIDFLDDVIKKLAPVLFKETMLPLFGHWLTVWAMAPEERLQEAMDFVFEGEYAKDKDLSDLKAKVEAYNSLVRNNRKDTLVAFDEDARVAVISRYGHVCFPVTSSWALAGDAVIETKSSSLGAVTAPIGDYFSDEYLAGKDMKYISPDKTIDASTCLFPEKTWFIKGVLHEETQYTQTMRTEILFGNEEATCDNYEFSRFMILDEDTDSLVTDESVPQKAEKLTPMQRLYNFLKALLKKLLSLFTKQK